MAGTNTSMDAEVVSSTSFKWFFLNSIAASYMNSSMSSVLKVRSASGASRERPPTFIGAEQFVDVLDLLMHQCH